MTLLLTFLQKSEKSKKKYFQVFLMSELLRVQLVANPFQVTCTLSSGMVADWQP